MAVVSKDQLSADDYLAAARGHAFALPSLYSKGCFALTIFVAGLAAECVFRAYRAKRGLPFRSDHLLVVLAEESGISMKMPHSQQARFGIALGELGLMWRNSHRSNEALRRFLKDLRLDRGIKGDFVKERARRLISRADEIVTLGIEKWQR